MGELYITDLDRTLLNSDVQLSEYSRGRIEHFLRQGLQFTVASARSWVSIRQIIGELNLRLPVINFNGGFITDYQTGEHLIVNSISSELSAELHGFLTANAPAPFISTHNTKTSDRLYYPEVENDGMGWYLKDRKAVNDPRLLQLKDVNSALSENVMALTCIGTLGQLSEVAEEITQRYSDRLTIYIQHNFYSPDWYWLTVHSLESTKERAIVRLQRLCGLEHLKLTAFGDHLNDIGMLELADRAVVVEEAEPEAKRIADSVIGSHDQDAVVRFIEAEWTPQSRQG